MSGRKSFIVRMKSSPTYALIIENFAKVSYWVITLRVNTIRFTLSAFQSLKKITEMMKVNTVSFVTSATFFKVLLRIISTLKVNTVAFTATVRVLWKWIITVRVNSVIMSIAVYMRYRFANMTMKVNSMVVSGYPITGQFPLLSFYDADYLSDMDGEYLSDLEFVEI